jgi:hypothetical protein
MPALKRCGDRVYFEFGIRRQSGSRLQSQLLVELYFTRFSSETASSADISTLDLQSEPQPISDGSSPFFIWKAARRFAAAIIVVASEDQADGIPLGMAFVAAYFQAT